MTGTELTQSSVSVERRETRQLFRAGVAAGVVATVANLVVVYVVPAIFNFRVEVPLQGPGSPIQPMPAWLVAMTTLAMALGATLLLAALNRITARPVRVFRWIAVIFLLLSFGLPFTVSPPLSVLLTLEAMHLIAGVTIIYFLTARPVEETSA